MKRIIPGNYAGIIGACIFVFVFAYIGHSLLHHSNADNPDGPTAPPVTWCEDSNFPGDQDSYTTAPVGAVTVPAGNNTSNAVNNSSPNTTYWFAAGTHTGISIQTADGDTYIGAPGAILDGGGTLRNVFTGQYNDLADQSVTIEYLTIKNYDPDQGGGAVNTNGNNGWTEEDNLIEDNTPGAGMMLGGDNTVNNNCMTENGEYGFQGYSYVDETYGTTFTGGAINITFTGNDISYNNTQLTQEGIEGGGKFWQNGNVTVTGNYFHDNYDAPGVWMDTDNAGFLVKNNYISNNGGEGLMYEISYNADITQNTFVGNGEVSGPGNPGFPTGAIYISESAGDNRVASNYSGQLAITDNTFTNNYDGVVLWQNINRYVGDGQDPGTLVPPSGVNITDWIDTVGDADCPGKLTETSPVDYHDLCHWYTQNVSVENNIFTNTTSDTSTSEGENAIFSDFSSTAAYPSWTGNNDISNLQNNVFADNTYNGPWNFMYFNQGDTTGFSGWQAGHTNVEASGYNFPPQDAGSTYDATNVTPPPSTPNNVNAAANSSTSVTVTWSASSDSGGPGLGGYHILRNGSQIGSVGSGTTTYTDTNAVADTQYSYTVEAYDTAAPPNVSAASSAAVVTTPASGNNPTVNITSPANNAVVHGGSVTVNATATPSAGNSITSAQLLVNGTVVQTLTSGPFIFSFSSLSYADGNNTVAVKATDNQGHSSTLALTFIATNGDLNGDGKVNLSDLIVMAQHYGQAGTFSYSQGNLTGAGTSPEVNLSDLIVLAKNYGYNDGLGH